MASFQYAPPTQNALGAWTNFGTNLTNDQLEGAYRRDSTLDWKAAQTRKIGDAYEHPETFFRNKATAIEGAARKAAVVYREEFHNLTKTLVPASLAHTRATRMAQGYEELLRADIEEQFPSDLSNLSLQLTYDRGTAAKSGFARPDAQIESVPAGTRAAPRRKASRK